MSILNVAAKDVLVGKVGDSVEGEACLSDASSVIHVTYETVASILRQCERWDDSLSTPGWLLSANQGNFRRIRSSNRGNTDRI